MFPSDLVKDVILASDIMGGGVHGWMSPCIEEPTDGGAHKWRSPRMEEPMDGGAHRERSPWMEEPTDVCGLRDGVGVFSHRDTMQTDTSPFSLLGGKVTAELTSNCTAFLTA